MKLSFTFLLVTFSACVFSQEVFKNKAGHYQITAPPGWTVEQHDEVMSVYAPADGDMDTWQEKLEISITEAKDLNLEDGFMFYIEQDLPAMYNQFSVVKKGDEVINGLNVKWAVISFAGSGTIGTSEVTFTLYNLFYLVLKDGKFFMLNGIAEKDYFPKLENDFLKIVRSFQFVK